MRRIVEVARPERVIPFGSAARGQMGPDSDPDVLVLQRGAHRRRLAGEIDANLIGIGQAVDVVVVTPEDIERYADSPVTIIRPALREGRIVHGE